MPSFIDPNSILKELALKEDAIAADFGCGAGGWALPLALILGKGKVFAIDVQESALSALEGKAKAKGIQNIEKILSDIEDGCSSLPSGTLDLVLITNLLFQLENKNKVFQEAKRVLKPQGKLLVVEWQKGALMGPKTPIPSQQEIEGLALQNGFNLFKEIQLNPGDYHFALVFQKQ